MNKTKRIRLDRLLVEKGVLATRERARAFIMAGSVLVEENIVDKAGALVFPDAALRLRGEDNPYVGRGGLKLKGALENFGINVRDLVALDVGASTGGFSTDLMSVAKYLMRIFETVSSR